ncbi:MAG: Fe(3+) ABC transporter substrate-binding protein [Clostridium sp.]
MGINKKKLIALTAASILTLGIVTGCTPKSGGAEADKEKVVNIYSARHYEVDKELYKEFEEETGIKVNVVEGKAPELLERLKRVGKDTEADVFATADIANLYQAVEGGLTESIESKIIDENIPENLRGKNNEWVGLTTRARIIAYDKEKVKPEELSTYEDLVNSKWKGQVLTRSSESSYNQSLLASFIELNGEEKAKEWAQGLMNNFAREPQGNDRDQVKGVAAGEGKLAIVNTYYIGAMINSKDAEEVKAAEKIAIYFPKDTHINVSGIVLSKYSKNKENAIKFVEFMSGERAQKAITDNNYEYPANKSVEPNALLKSWGEFTPQNIDLTKVGEYNKTAVKIFDEIGWK